MKGIQSPYEPRHEAQAPEELPVHGHHPSDDWQVAIAAYLAKRCDMGPISIFEVLRDCEFDEVTRARYLKLARGTMP